MANQPKRILLTGGRSTITLDIARHFHKAGHFVYVADSHRKHICKFSNAVSKNFQVPSPRFHSEQFIESLISIIEKHNIDLYIPTCEETIYISYALSKFPKSCEVFCEPFELLHSLHSKWLFMEKLKELGIDVPKTVLIKSQNDLENLNLPYSYALKATYSRASQNMCRVDPGSAAPAVKIEPYNPWVAQEWIKGVKYCTYSIVKEGKIYAHSTYPVSFTVDGSSCITFEAIRHQKILDWVTRFVGLTRFTGQIAFDFIETDQSKLYAIECNPRATHGLHLFNEDDEIQKGFFGKNKEIIHPKEGTLKQIGMGMVAFGWRSVNRGPQLPGFLKNFFAAKDVVYQKNDLKPFFAMGTLFPMYWYMCKKYRLPLSAVFTFDTDWNGEAIYIHEPQEAECTTKKKLNMG